MDVLKFDLNSSGNKIKILNATNGGPRHKRHAGDRFRSNYDTHPSAFNGVFDFYTYEIYRVDNEHGGKLTEITDNLSFDMDLFSIVLVKEK